LEWTIEVVIVHCPLMVASVTNAHEMGTLSLRANLFHIEV